MDGHRLWHHSFSLGRTALFASTHVRQDGAADTWWHAGGVGGVDLLLPGDLLAGYCYAHLLNRYVPVRWAPFVHAAVLAVAFLALPIGLPESAANPPPGGEYLWLIGVLASGVGLPFFAISATAPLLQAWFTRSASARAADPYFLYGASNVGSLLALVSYPFLIEPMIGLSSQLSVWVVGFATLAFLIAVCAVQIGRDNQAPAESGAVAGPDNSITWRQRLHWIACAFIPSGLLVAFTSFVTTDVASAPFLWVMPLALFLGTFVVVFRDKEIIPQAALIDRLPLIAAALVLITSCSSAFPLPIAFGVGLLAFLATALACHRELYLSRPSGHHLTEFYLWMSFGGALGGVFSAIIAPQMFTTIFEFPLLAVAGLLVSPLIIGDTDWLGSWWRAALFGVAAVIVIALLNAAAGAGLITGSSALRLLVLTGLLGAMFALRDEPRLQLGVVVFMLLAAPFVPEGNNVRHATRSFFGSLRVMETEGGAVRFFLHGTTSHGAERRRDASGSPVRSPVPAQYYHATGPLARGLDVARAATGRAPGDFRAAIVGLGIGAMACHKRPGETWRFYEIDPAVVELARDGSQFTFLSTCEPAADIVVGDARLTLAKEQPHFFDYLLLDAFSSDAVPTHLLTAEAIAMYLDKLTDRGVLAMHVSNRHLDLVSVVLAAVQEMPGVQAVVVRDPAYATAGDYDKSPSEAVLISRGDLSAVGGWPGAVPAAPTQVATWTDDYSNILAALWRHYVR